MNTKADSSTIKRDTVINMKKNTMKEKKPLYRKVNTRTRGVRHLHGSDYSKTRHRSDVLTGMSKGLQRGLDYTPLYKFLLSKVGNCWNEIYSEAISRLDKPDPIFNMVAKRQDLGNDIILESESTYFSGLYIDTDGTLQVVNPDINEDSLKPFCKCCTHTFNGIPFSQKYTV
ncbi:hypothetical protein [Photobacterium angustum]|uniref:hypothetical protein n=1 Tax=Photobacterium angustum TaxID=661 RepID=UPI000ADEA9F6|nr:hypothetical protein [Photobacterium angustum]